MMIKVYDKNGNELESTYPKRAHGLVKKGRARFISEGAIVLEEVNTQKTEACPPIDKHSEDMNMFDSSFNSSNTYFGEIYDTKVRSKSVCGSLSGTVIGAGAGRKTSVNAFDGNFDTQSALHNNYGEAVEQWFGVRLDEPAAVKYIMVATGCSWMYRSGNRREHAILGSYFQGSMDGQLWTTLAVFTEEDYLAYLASEKTYYTKAIDCPVPYTYYRYFNYDDGGVNNLCSLLLFGEMTEGSTVDTYRGEISYTGVRSTSVCGSLEGMIIGAGGDDRAYCGAFDGRLDTLTQFGINLGEGVDCWYGIKADEPTVLRHVVIASPNGNRRHVIRDSYFQGSNDGVNWTTLAHFDDGDYHAYLNTSRKYYTKPITDPTAYTHFRYFNYDDGGSNSLSELLLFTTTQVPEIRFTDEKSWTERIFRNESRETHVPRTEAYNTRPADTADDGRNAVKKYVADQMNILNTMMMSSQSTLMEQFMSGAITPQQYEERLTVVRQDCDKRMLQLREMLSDTENTQSQTKNFQRNIQEKVQNFLDHRFGTGEFSARVNIDLDDDEDAEELEDMACDIEDMACDIEDMADDVRHGRYGNIINEETKEALKEKINDALERIRSMLE